MRWHGPLVFSCQPASSRWRPKLESTCSPPSPRGVITGLCSSLLAPVRHFDAISPTHQDAGSANIVRCRFGFDGRFARGQMWSILMTYRAIDIYFSRIDVNSFGFSRTLVWRRAYLYEYFPQHPHSGLPLNRSTDVPY